MIHYEEMQRLIELHYESRKYISLSKKNENHSNVSDFASSLLTNYTGLTYINTYLRKSKSTRKSEYNDGKELLEYLLNKALDELNGHNNQIVYRMDSPNISFDILKLWYKKRIGEVICFPNFLSTSKKRWVERDKVFKIRTNNSSSGRDLIAVVAEGLAEYENEVLFKSRTKFKIIDVKTDFIELQEVSRQTDTFIMIYDNTYYADSDVIKELDKTEVVREKSFLEMYG